MTCLKTGIGAGLALAVVVAVSAMTGQEVFDFSVPEYAPDGRLKTHVRGKRAVIDARGDADIEHLQLDIFPENGQNMHIVAPSCRFYRSRGIVESSGDVRIETPSLLITGTGFRWNPEAGRGLIQSNVSVTIYNSEGLYSREP